MTDTFVHLRLHSEYSIEDSIVPIDRLSNAAVRDKHPALALTDVNNVFAAVKFYRACLNSGIKPLLGSELKVLSDSEHSKTYSLVLLCQNLQGYRNLCHLISRGYQEGQVQGVAHIQLDWLEAYTDGLICLSGGMQTELGHALLHQPKKTAVVIAQRFQQFFPDRFYLELQRTGKPLEENYIVSAVKLASELNLPVVATNDVRFLQSADFEAHEARVCIQSGYTLNDQRRPKVYTEQQYFKPADDMQALFHDLPEAIENTVEIAKRCNVELTLGEHFLPDFPVPKGYDQASWMQHQAQEGLQNILDTASTPLDEPLYRQRLEHEISVITEMGFPGYFLIVADFIQWAKNNHIPVGPGRGSGAGSLVAYALGITELDPIYYELLFERFLNPERVSLPDFDIDFCMERRDEVIEYVAQKYGRNHVSQIITYGSMAAKAVVRDVGRVLGYPYGFVDQIAKLIPFEIGITLDRALQSEELLRDRYKKEDDVKTLIDLALKLEGLSRNAGKHAGGIVIAPKPLTDYMPLYCEQGSTAIVSQFDMNDVEAVGLVKFDFLGLRTLTIIDWTVTEVNKLLASQQQPMLNISEIPLDDQQCYELIQRMDTTAIFQLESDGMKKLIGRLKPDKFDDLIALVALFRPGPLQSGMVDDYVERKHGRAVVTYPHPELEPILKPTYGVILYQEQVMQIAQVLAGYTLGAADLLRRAMGKKKPEEMAKQREIFTKGSVERGVESKQATFIFDLMEKFAGYGFNKSHSAAYALVAYQTAWLKTHYPAAFMASVLSSDMDNTDKVVMLRSEIEGMGLNLVSPDINNSKHAFTVLDDKTILYGLGAVKGVGQAAIEGVIDEIDNNGAFKDLFDFCKRVNLQKVNRRVLEALINCGAMDQLGPSRSILMNSLDKAIQLAEQFTNTKNSGQMDVFGFDNSQQEDDNSSEFLACADWSDDERLKREKESLGFYLDGHPIEKYRKEIFSITKNILKNIQKGQVTVAAYIHSIRVRNTSRGKMAEIRLDDNTALEVMTVYAETYNRYHSILLKDQLVIVKGEVRDDDYSPTGQTIEAREIYSMAEYREQHAKLELIVSSQQQMNGELNTLKEILNQYHGGKTPITIIYDNGSAACQMALGADWQIIPSEDLLNQLKHQFGDDNVNLLYHS